MSSLSPRATGAIADFAGSLGLPPPPPARDGSVSFVFARSGTLTFTPAADGQRVLLSLGRATTRLDEAAEARILAAAGLDETLGRFFHTGVALDGSALVVVGLEEGEVDLPTIESAFRALTARHAAIA